MVLILLELALVTLLSFTRLITLQKVKLKSLSNQSV